MNVVRLLVSSVLIAQLAGCGTLMYPERRGQRSGRIDTGVAILDGIGLLLFIIPGLIAFAVDFSTGTIYLPGGVMRSALDRHDIKVARFDPKHSTAVTIEAILQRETGYRITLDQENMKVSRLASLEEMKKRFSVLVPSDRNIRVASSTK